MALKLSNNADGLLAMAISNSDTSLTLRAGHGSRFPALDPGDWFPITVVRASDPSQLEIMRCTGRSGDTLTVVRAQEGTSAIAFNAGDVVSLRLTVAALAGAHVDTATKLQTARNISLSGAVSGSVSFDGSRDVSISTVVADNSHNHVIANVSGLQSALNGKLDYFELPMQYDSQSWYKIAELTTNIGSEANGLVLFVSGISDLGINQPGMDIVQVSTRGTVSVDVYEVVPTTVVDTTYGYVNNAVTGKTELWVRRGSYNHKTGIAVGLAYDTYGATYGNLGTSATEPAGITYVSKKKFYHSGNFDPAVYAPPGMVAYFARNTAPPGWLKANGAAVSRTTYAALFAAIGTAFGAGDGATTFNLPDLRGEFIRGWDDDRGVDAGRAMGGWQNFAMQKITGRFSSWVRGDGAYMPSGAFYDTGARFNPKFAGGGGDLTLVGVGFDSGLVASTANETRPRNVALLACIKY